MVVRLNNLSKWAVLDPGDMLHLPGTYQRKVRVEVNCEASTSFMLVLKKTDAPDKGVFVANVTGHEVLEFSLPGEAWLMADGEGRVWYFTNEGDYPAVEFQNTKPFVELITPSQLDPNVERMMYRMKLNYERNLAAQAEEMAAQAAAIAELRAGQQQETQADDEAEDSDVDIGGTDEPEAEQPPT